MVAIPVVDLADLGNFSVQQLRCVYLKWTLLKSTYLCSHQGFNLQKRKRKLSTESWNSWITHFSPSASSFLLITESIKTRYTIMQMQLTTYLYMFHIYDCNSRLMMYWKPQSNFSNCQRASKTKRVAIRREATTVMLELTKKCRGIFQCC